MSEIILLNATKTKTGKTIIHYGFQDEREKYLKGFAVLEQWLEDSKIYDDFRDSDFGQKYLAEFGYEDTYNGQARKVINTLTTLDGEVIFAR